MQTLLNALRIALAIFPAVVDLVLVIEHAIPIPAVGADKLQLLKDVILDAYSAIDEESRKSLSLDGVLKVVAVLATRLVQVFNKVGWPAAGTALDPSR